MDKPERQRPVSTQTWTGTVSSSLHGLPGVDERYHTLRHEDTYRRYKRIVGSRLCAIVRGPAKVHCSSGGEQPTANIRHQNRRVSDGLMSVFHIGLGAEACMGYRITSAYEA